MKERLQKTIARAGLASRRQAEQLILGGLVKVNGKTITSLGSRADPLRDSIKVAGKRIRPQPLEYYAVNKPRLVLSSVSDSGGRPLVTQLVSSNRRLYPAGRLDFESEGLVILTNDGDLTRQLTAAGRWPKLYQVKVQGRPSRSALTLLEKGIEVGGEQWAPVRVRPRNVSHNSWFEVELRQGKNRQIRRMFQAIGHRVMRLRRVAIGPVQLGDLRPGQSRRLTPQELQKLQQGPANQGL